MFKRATASFKTLCICLGITLLAVFLLVDVLKVKDSIASELGLPSPTALLVVSEDYSMPVLKGLKLNPDNPFEIEFLIDTADHSRVSNEEISRFVSYFMAGVTTEKDDVWVNLSPYEQDRVIDKTLQDTDLGRDLMAQDYVLKQLASSLTSPGTKTGDDYWSKFSTLDSRFSIGSKASNKIWIKPDIAKVYEEGNVVLITESSLKVESEDDVNEMLLPSITKDVNNGRNFACLRQVYSAMILSEWFKNKVRDSLYSAYVNSSKTDSLELEEKGLKDKIYSLYIESFTSGVYNFIKKEIDAASKQKVKRNYFSGGYQNIVELENVDSYSVESASIASAIVTLNPLVNKGISSTVKLLALVAMTAMLTFPNESYAGRRARRKAALEAPKTEKTPLEKYIPGMVELKKNYLKYSSISEDYNKEQLTANAIDILNKLEAYVDSYLSKSDKPYAEAFELLIDYTDLLKAYGENIVEPLRHRALDNLIGDIEKMITVGESQKAKQELMKYKYHFIVSGRINDYRKYENKISEIGSSALSVNAQRIVDEVVEKAGIDLELNLSGIAVKDLIQIVDELGNINVYETRHLRKVISAMIIPGKRYSNWRPVLAALMKLAKRWDKHLTRGRSFASLAKKIVLSALQNGEDVELEIIVDLIEELRINYPMHNPEMKLLQDHKIAMEIIKVSDNQQEPDRRAMLELLTNALDSNIQKHEIRLDNVRANVLLASFRYLLEVNQYKPIQKVVLAMTKLGQRYEAWHDIAALLIQEETGDEWHFGLGKKLAPLAAKLIVEAILAGEKVDRDLVVGLKKLLSSAKFRVGNDSVEVIDNYITNGGVEMDSLSVEVEGSSSALFAFHSLQCAVEDFAGFSFDIKSVTNNVAISNYFN